MAFFAAFDGISRLEGVVYFTSRVGVFYQPISGYFRHLSGCNSPSEGVVRIAIGGIFRRLYLGLVWWCYFPTVGATLLGMTNLVLNDYQG